MKELEICIYLKKEKVILLALEESGSIGILKR